MYANYFIILYMVSSSFLFLFFFSFSRKIIQHRKKWLNRFSTSRVKICRKFRQKSQQLWFVGFRWRDFYSPNGSHCSCPIDINVGELNAPSLSRYSPQHSTMLRTRFGPPSPKNKTKKKKKKNLSIFLSSERRKIQFYRRKIINSQ